MSRNLLVCVLAVGFGLSLTAVPLLAHHSFAAEYDGTKPVKVTGKVVKVEWMNPHIWFYVEGKDETTGRTAVWGFSGGPPATMARRPNPSICRRDMLASVIVCPFLLNRFCSRRDAPRQTGWIVGACRPGS